MTSDPYQVGVIGAGWISENLHLPIADKIDRTEIAYVADIDERRASRLAGFYGASPVEIGEDLTALPSCDIAVLAIPVGARHRYVMEFARRGTAMFTEKPVAVDLAEHGRYLEASDTIYCNYQRREASSTQQVRELVDSGLFGKLRHVRLSEGGIVGSTGKATDHYQTKPELSGGGILMEKGCHPLSQLTYVLPDCTYRVAEADIVANRGLDTDVRARIEVEGLDDCTVDFHVSYVRDIDTVARLEFDGATVEFDPADMGGEVTFTPRDGAETIDAFRLTTDDSFARSFHQAAYLRWTTFLDGLDGDRNWDAGTATGHAVTELIDQIYDASDFERGLAR